MSSFRRDAHISYLWSCLNGFPSQYTSMDTSRITALYFAVVGLDICGETIPASDADRIRDFVYSMQIVSIQDGIDRDEVQVKYPGCCGFLGSNYLGCEQTMHTANQNPLASSTCIPCGINLPVFKTYLEGHLAMAYTALAILRSIGDDYSRLDKQNLLQGMKKLQQPNGSFCATYSGSEADTRFIYCACAVSSFLDDWSGIDTDQATSYIKSCLTYDGGISLLPGSEAHGGSCYCGIASLALMGRLHELGEDSIELLVHWCMQRQVGGFQGRTNKDADTCYSFWIGASLAILNRFQDTDDSSTRSFILNDCQGGLLPTGGFSKSPGSYPDILHTFYSLSWLSMDGDVEGLREIDPSLGICRPI